MSQTKQQEPASAPPRARRDWEWFWRIVAGLMLLFIGWVAWVLYQITPRSVVTPLAYATQVRPIGTLHPPEVAPAPAATPAAALPRPAPGLSEADEAMGLAQAAALAGAHQASADVQAAAQAQKDAQVRGGGLRLATEISTPMSGKQDNLTQPEAKTGGKPAATDAAEKDRP